MTDMIDTPDALLHVSFLELLVFARVDGGGGIILARESKLESVREKREKCALLHHRAVNISMSNMASRLRRLPPSNMSRLRGGAELKSRI